MDKHSAFKDELRARLQQQLPGEEVQLKMAPVFRKPVSAYGDKINSARRAAVLLLVFEHENELSTLLIQRTEGGIHASQIALPGGSCEEQDKDETETAVRECIEEIAISPGEIDILGKLSPVYIPPSNFLVTPVIGWYKGKHDFKPAELEVFRIIIEPLKHFTDPERVFTSTFIMHTGIPTEAPAYKLREDVMWGATAMMFSEFTAVIKGLI